MAYSDDLVQRVWEKGRAYAEIGNDIWREDECGAWIRREDYGRTDSEFGWKIVNVSGGGADKVENLRPFHHQNSYDLGNRKQVQHVVADRKGMAVFEHNFEPKNRKA